MQKIPLPPWRINAEPTADELADYRTLLRMQSIKAHLQEEQERKQAELMMKVKPEVDADPDWAINLISVNSRTGKPTIHRQVLAAAPPELRALLASDPYLCTGLQWTNMAIEGRMEICTSFGLDVAAAMATDIREVLNEESDHYLESWQRLINDGTVWNVSGVVGRRAEALIVAGFLLRAPQPTEGTWNDAPSRHDVPAGMPGSPAFVRVMMGDSYLAWIEAVR